MSKESDDYKAALTAVADLETQLGLANQAKIKAETILQDGSRTSEELDAAATSWKQAVADQAAAQNAMAAAQTARQTARQALLDSKESKK